SEEVVHRVGGAANRDLDVVVPHQELTAADGVACRRHVPGAEVSMRMGVRHPLVADDRLELAALDHSARRLEVVEDRLEAGEALEAHHLLRQERPVVPGDDVALPGQLAETLVERHEWRISPRGSSGRSAPGTASRGTRTGSAASSSGSAG